MLPVHWQLQSVLLPLADQQVAPAPKPSPTHWELEPQVQEYWPPPAETHLPPLHEIPHELQLFWSFLATQLPVQQYLPEPQPVPLLTVRVQPVDAEVFLLAQVPSAAQA